MELTHRHAVDIAKPPEHHIHEPFDVNSSHSIHYDDAFSHYIDDEPLYYSDTYKIVGANVGILILAIGFFMNTVLIHTVRKCPSMFAPMPASSLCRLLIYLAVVDNFVLATSCTLHVIELFLVFNQWIFGKAGCAVLGFLQYASNDAVGLAVLLLAVERYFTYSQNSANFVKRSGLMIRLCTTFAAFFCIPWIVLSRTTVTRYGAEHDADRMDVEECKYNFSQRDYSIYYLFDTIIFYFLPLFTAVVLYIMMFTPVDRMQAALDRQKGDAEKVYWMLCISTVLMFGCAVLPFRIMVLFDVFSTQKFLNLWFIMFARMTMYAGSALKPVVYLAFSRRFRRGFRNVLLCRNRAEDNLNVEMEASML